jgi:hypothetical protein
MNQALSSDAAIVTREISEARSKKPEARGQKPEARSKNAISLAAESGLSSVSLLLASGFFSIASNHQSTISVADKGAKPWQ